MAAPTKKDLDILQASIIDMGRELHELKEHLRNLEIQMKGYNKIKKEAS